MLPSPPHRPSWYRRLYTRVGALSSTRHAFAGLLGVSLIEASVFPVPPFALLIPMVLAAPPRWWRLALWGAGASLIGGLIGYGLGAGFGEGIALLLGVNLDAPIRSARLGIDSSLGQLLGDNFWVLALMASVLPTPFKVISLGSGMVGVPLAKFVLAVAIGRGFRFLAVAAVMRFVGPTARRWFKA